jgi:putative peptide zinc metalloprotease protein
VRRLFEFKHNDIAFAVEGSDWSGLERVLVDDRVVSSKRSFGSENSHSFSVSELGAVELAFHIRAKDGQVDYTLRRGTETLTAGSAPLPWPLVKAVLKPGTNSESNAPAQAPSPHPGLFGHGITLVAGLFKLFKSATAVKVALAGSAFAGWSIMADWRFAVMILSIITFHEYGHVLAMKRCGIPTRGFYIIPFFGGIALGEKARSYWHEVFVAMMGPVFGLLMSFLAWAAYWLTGIEMLGLVAAFGALINLINLLPVYPLDGGHVLKAVALSASPRHSFWLLLAISAIGVAATVHLELFLFSVFIVLGTVDLIFTRRSAASLKTEPMNINGMAVSLLWYVLVVAAFVLVIVTMEATGVPGAEIPSIVLSD